MSLSEVSIARAQQLADQVSGQPENVDAALPELAALLRDSTDPEVLIAVALALNETWDERASALLLPLVDHPDPLVREAVTHALPGGVTSAAMLTEVTAALVRLASDVADEVRNWACFGLGQLAVDGPEVRAALLDNLDHADLDTRSEALLALARLGDPASLSAATERLGADPDDVALLELQAAAELADPVLLPVLERLAVAWAGDDDDHTAALDFARRRCALSAAERAAELESALDNSVNGRLEDTGCGIRLAGSYPRTMAHIVRPGDREAEGYRVWEAEVPDSFDLEEQTESYVVTARE